MGTRRRYYVNGHRVPGVTTILGILEKPGLIHWAWDLGMHGINYKDKRDDAADVGKMLHELFMYWAKKDADPCKQLPAGPDCDKARELYGRVQPYMEANSWQPLGIKDMDGNFCSAEIALVHPDYEYGGAIDGVIVEPSGRTVLTDWKSSKRPYDSHFYQLAGYRELLRVNGTHVDAVRVVCIPRDGDGWTIHTLTNTDHALGIFLRAREIYALKQLHQKTEIPERLEMAA